MYHPFIEAVSLTLIDMPIMLFTLVFFAIPMYFLVRLQRSASQFLYVVHYLLPSYGILTTSAASTSSYSTLPPLS